MLSFSKRLPFPFFSGGEGYYPWLCCTNIKDSDNSVMFQFFLGVVYFEGIILNFKAGCSWATHPQVWWALNFTFYFSCSMNLVQALLNFQPLLTSNIGRYIQQKVTPKQSHIPAFFLFQVFALQFYSDSNSFKQIWLLSNFCQDLLVFIQIL